MKDAKRLSKPSTATIITQSGRGAVRLACLHGVQEVEGSNPFAPTKKPLSGFFYFYIFRQYQSDFGIITTCQ